MPFGSEVLQSPAWLRREHMKRFFFLILVIFSMLAAACLPTPPAELLVTRTPLPSQTPAAAPMQDADPSPTPSMVEIGGRMVSVDKAVSGLLCDDVWQGTIYVAPGIQVNPWVDTPNFLIECSLVVTPGTIVYVAAHPGEVFYKGCTCHE